MKVEFTAEEVQAMVNYVLDQLGAIEELDRKDRATLRRWRGDDLRLGSPTMQLLTDRVNAELQRIHEAAHVSAITKPDWL
ncbi:MAG: hypothetical protein K1X87_00815 [Dehalococcoidia bacterium]|nr:hypothetical protein [Dehalococcoidia bacterium]HRC61847.1 hypothetical protein [Dehalococcoidia bacterium]